MLRHVVGDLDLLRDSVPARNRRGARVELGAINTLAPVLLERVAGKPIIPPARLALRAVGAIPALLPVNIRAAKQPLVETILRRLLLLLSRHVLRIQELVDNLLILADAVREHAAVVAVMIDAPLHLDDLTGRVDGCRLGAPVGGGLVVVNVYPGVETAGAAAADGSGVEVWPGGDGLEDHAFRAGVLSGLGVLAFSRVFDLWKRVAYLEAEAGSAVGDCQVAVSADGRGEGEERQGDVLLHGEGL